jgi:hypothetical protein
MPKESVPVIYLNAKYKINEAPGTIHLSKQLAHTHFISFMSSPYLYQKSQFSTNSSPIISPTDSQTTSLRSSRAQMVQNYLQEHVPQWQDDTLIQSLFANLPNREVKPEAFAQKYYFWKDLLISMTRNRLLGGSVFKFNSKSISSFFHRGGLQPVCLNGIINEMMQEGIVQDCTIDFDSNAGSSVFGTLNWILGSLKTLMIGSSNDSHDSLEATEYSLPSQLLIMSLLEEQESLILDVLNSQNAHIPLTFEEFHNLVNESRITAGLVEITDKDDVLLLLRFLKSKGLLNYSPLIEVVTDKVLLAIKLKASAITQIDFDIVKLKKLHMRLNVQVHDLSKSIKDLTDSAKTSLLQSNDRKMALYQLKRRKLLEQTQDERLRSLHSLDDILFRICSVSDDEQILAAYKTGAKALKQLMPDADEIDETMDELQDLLTGHEEISQSLSPSVEYSEFEDELEALLNLDKVSIVSSKEERENIEISAGMSSDVEHNNATKAEADKQKVPDLV